MAPEARGDNKFLTLSIARGPVRVGKKEEVGKLWRPRPEMRFIYTVTDLVSEVSVH